MFRYKTRRHAFIIAAMVILICFVCLVGATLAIFTDELDGAIAIVTTSGEVKVDIIDPQTGASLEGTHLVFQTNNLFEPGATYRTQGFKVSNDGTAPVAFRIYVSDNIGADTALRQEFFEAFDVWLVTDPDNLNDRIDMTKYEKDLRPQDVSEDTYYLVARMKTTAGDYYQNKTYENIIGVTVYAVQDNAIAEE